MQFGQTSDQQTPVNFNDRKDSEGAVSEGKAFNRKGLEVASTCGDPSVATIFVARTRPGDDTSMIEFVDGLDWNHPRHDKWIINVSTQFGCPVGCRFCDAAHRYHGNLSADEMLAQVRHVTDMYPGLAERCRKLKVHFARMGEPALNRAVLDAIERLPATVNSPGLWACVATTAPRGTEDWFERLIDVRDRHFRKRFQLQFSINTTDEDFRQDMTAVRLLPFKWIRDYASRFFQDGERKVILNFALGRAVPFDAHKLLRQFDPVTTCVKLTPLNPTARGAENGMSGINREDLERIATMLNENGFDAVLSIGDPREDDIGSNCGQSVRRLADRR